MQCISSIGRAAKVTAETIFSYSIPGSPTIAAISFATGWYGRRIVLTYGPGLLANFFMSKAYLGSPLLGKIIGGLIVAPTLVPSITPMIALGSSVAVAWVTCILCNIVARKIFGSYPKPPDPVVIVDCQK